MMQSTQRAAVAQDTPRRATPRSGGRRGQLLLYLTLRELRTRYRRTLLGWTWSLVNPLVTALVFAAVFGAFFRVVPPTGNPSGIDSFWVFMLTGLLPWSMFSVAINASMGSMIVNAGLIQKVRFQRSTLVVSACVAAAVTLLIEMVVAVVLVAVFERPLVFAYALWLPLIIALLLGFCVGFGLVLAALNVYFRDMQYLMGLVLLAWFYLTPIVYPLTLVPDTWGLLQWDLPARDLVELNPMTRFIAVVRDVTYDLRSPSLLSLAELALLAGVSLLVGSVVFGRLQGRFAEEL